MGLRLNTKEIEVDELESADAWYLEWDASY